jgi:nucleotide-binding universal stress UspA family protein
MSTIPVGSRLVLKNLLFLSDFSDASEFAIPYVLNLARKYDAKVHALHAVTPAATESGDAISMADALEGMEESAQSGMQRLDAQLFGVDHSMILSRGESVWHSVRTALHDHNADMLILGTHGRTGSLKQMMGSVAEEIFRKSPVPVLTIGPATRIGAHSGGSFHSVLCATDFNPEAEAALPYAISLAQENQAKLNLLHVLPKPGSRQGPVQPSQTVADAMHHLQRLVPSGAAMWCRPEAIVKFGDTSDRILATAREVSADLIVLGARDPGARLGEVTHFEGGIAHRVVANALCPVLTKRL